jgi:crossover junction endodeoxyribonuclease RuvC
MTDGTLIVGIDPGLNTTGYGVLEMTAGTPRLLEAGVVRSTPQKNLTYRVAEIHRGVAEVLRVFRPGAVAIEELYTHYDRPQTAILMGHARGVICLAAALVESPVYHYGATRIKKLLTGNGRAPKEQVQESIRRELRLGSLPEPSDVADALAVALCHSFSMQFQHVGESS